MDDFSTMVSHPYLRLKLAKKLFGKMPAALDDIERRRLEATVSRQWQIEQRILGAPEAARVVVPPSSVQQAVAEVRSRYAEEDEYRTELRRAGLDPAALAEALARDLKVDAVLEQVAAEAGEASATDAEIFYRMHQESFRKPERRRLRHILVTINEALPGNSRFEAHSRLSAIRERLLANRDGFADEALRHSECPTAMRGGDLGHVHRGRLYPEIDDAAFALAVGELSAIVESPLGFHLVECLSIAEAGVLPWQKVRKGLRQRLTETRRSEHQKAWIASLFEERRAAA